MVHKVLQELQRLANDQGWEIERTGSGHLRWVSPEGNVVSTSSTPSDEGIIKTIRSDLARQGLILDKGEARRLKKKIKRGEADSVGITGQPGFEASPLTFKRPDKPVSEWTDEQIFSGLDNLQMRMGAPSPTGHLTRRERKAYAEMVRHVEDYAPAVPKHWPTTCSCGFSTDDEDGTLVLYLHLQQRVLAGTARRRGVRRAGPGQSVRRG